MTTVRVRAPNLVSGPVDLHETVRRLSLGHRLLWVGPGRSCLTTGFPHAVTDVRREDLYVAVGAMLETAVVGATRRELRRPHVRTSRAAGSRP